MARVQRAVEYVILKLKFEVPTGVLDVMSEEEEIKFKRIDRYRMHRIR
jgi:hypothetical protein